MFEVASLKGRRVLLALAASTALLAASSASAALNVTPLTWNIVGLDSNTPATGPEFFPVGARVCSDIATTNVTVNYVWDSANPLVNLRPGSLSSIVFPAIGAGACVDAYFEVAVTRNAAAFDTTRRYRITATDGSGTASTPAPRELYVERLVSQARNAVTNVLYGPVGGPLVPVAPGAAMNLVVGNQYDIRLDGGTATGGYEQFKAFINFSNTIFRITNVNTTLSVVAPPRVVSPNNRLYQDGCLWENDPNSPNYRACLSTGKAGGSSVSTTYTIQIIGGGGTSQTLNTLLYDFSGSSYHYNADYGVGGRIANVIDPASAGIAKAFIPSTTSVGGVSKLQITLTNPNAGALPGFAFTDTLPAGMTFASPTALSTTGCGTPTFTPAVVAGGNSIGFSNGTVAANSSCVIAVNVVTNAVAADSFLNTTGNLLVGAVDTGKTASATLTVSNAPPPPLPLCGLPMASWDFLTGSSATNPAPTSSSVAASANAGAGLTPTIEADNVSGASGSWSSDFISTGALVTANNQYFEFVLDTTGFTSVDVSFQGKRTAQGPTVAQLFSGLTGSTAGPSFTLTAAFQPFGPSTISAGLNPAGNTLFRIYLSNASQNNNGHAGFLDGVTFTGCAAPQHATLAKAFVPTAIGVGAGGVSTLTFTLTNPNAASLTGAAFTDALPAGLQVAAVPAAVSGCGGSWAPAAGSTNLVFSGGTIPASGSCTVQVNVTATTPGPKANTSGSISTTQTGTNFGPTGSAGATLTALAPPSIDKTFGPNPILTNGVSTLTFVIVNPNPDNAVGSVAFVDTFPVAPGAMLVAATPNASTTGCGAPTFAPSAGSGSIAFSGGSIAAGGTCTVRVDVTAPLAGSYLNTSGPVSHVVGGTPFNGNTTTDTLVVNAPSPGVALLKEVGASPAGPWLNFLALPAGGNVFYRITVENTGDVPLNPLAVSDPAFPTLNTLCSFPASLPVAVAANDDHIATCIFDTGTPITAIDGTHPNTASADATGAGMPVSDNDTAVYATTGLTLAKSANPTSFTAAGQTITYSFLVTNSGFATLSGPVVISDPLVTATCPALTTVGDLDAFFDPGESVTCTASYDTTATDVANGFVSNTATASAGGATSPPSSVTITTPQTANLVLTKTLSSPAPYVPGGSATFTISITNNGPDAASNVSVGDSDINFTVTSVSSPTMSCPGAAFPCTLASLANGGNAVITVAGTIDAAGAFSNTATVSTTATDPDLNDNTDTDGDTAVPLADLSLAKLVDNATPTVGGSVVFTVTLANAGPNGATGVTVTDMLPAGYSFVSATPSQGSYVSATGVWTVGAVAASGSATLQINATVNASGSYANTAQVTASDQADPDSTPNNDAPAEDDQATATTTPVASADLSLTKIVDDATPDVGSNVVFTVTVSNAGPSGATGVQVLDLLPSGFTFVSSSPSQGTYTAGTGVWNLGALAASGSATLQITASVNASGIYANTAQVSAADQGDPDSTPNNNAPAEDDQATVTVTPGAVADLSLAKSVDDATPSVGANVVFTVTLANAGPSDATGVVVTDLLPAGYSFVSATPSQGGYTSATGVWTLGTVTAGGNATLQITASVNASGSYANTAQVTASDQGDPDSTPDNNAPAEDDQATASTTPVASADLSLGKMVDNAFPTVGSNVVFTVTVNNAGPSGATGVEVTDLVQAGYTFVSATPSQGSYTSATGVWTVGAVTAGGNATLQITASVNASGSYANTAQVTASDQADPDSTPNNNAPAEDDQATVVTTPVASADLSLVKIVDNAGQLVGNDVVFTLTLSNAGPSNATGVQVLDLLPSGFAFVSSTASQGTYTAGTGVWNIGAVAASGSATLQITATVNAAGVYTNTAQVSASDQDDPDSTPNNNAPAEDDQDTATVTPGAVADLSLAKAVDDATPTVGANVVFTLTLANAGPSDATGVEVTDLLPAGYSFVSATPSQGSYTSATGVWTVGAVAASGSATLQISASVNASGSYVNTAQVTNANEGDPDSTPGNNAPAEDDQASVSTTPVPSADLSLTKLVDDAAPTVGNNVLFTLTLTNAGPSNATGVQVTDLLPAGYVFVSATPSMGSYSNVTGVWDVGNLASGSGASLQVTATVAASGPYANVAEVTAVDQADPDSTPGNGDPSEDDRASVTPVPVASADVSLVKTLTTAGPYSVGQSVAFSIVVRNDGPSTATGVQVTDTPANLTITNVSGGGCAALPCTIASLPSGTDVTLTVSATIDSDGPFGNSATAIAAEPDPDPSDNSDDDSSSTTPGANLSITKSVDNATPVVGSNVTFTLTVSNAGPSTAAAVVASDLLPAGYSFVSATPSQGAYASGSGQWTVGNLANGASATLAIVATVNAAGPYANTASVTSDTPDPDPSDNSDTETPVPTPSADVSIVKSVDNATPAVGSNVTFILTLSNAGPSAATAVVASDLLPAGYSFVSATPSQGAYASGSGQWTVGNVASGASATLAIVATVNAAGPYANTASVTSDTPDPDPSDNSDTETPVPTPSADLSIAKTPSTPIPTIGGSMTFTLTLANAGPSGASGVIANDLLPAGYTFVSAAASQGSYDAGSGVWTVGNVASGAGATLAITVTVNEAGPYANTATVTATTPDPDPSDNSDTSTPTPVQGGPGSADVSILKTNNNATPTVGTQITFTLALANAGPDTAAAVTVQDLLPAGYTFVSATPSVGSYNAGSGAWTVGDLANGAGASLAITATVNASGPYANTATASSTTPDPDPVDNVSTSTPTPVPAVLMADLAVMKTGPAQIQRGQQLTFNIQVTNLGPDTAVNARLIDPTPAGLVFVSTAGACTSGFPCLLGDLANGAMRTLTATYFVPADYAGPNMIVNTVTALSDSQDPTPGDTSSSSSVLLPPGQANVVAPQVIPVDARWAMLLLAALMALLAGAHIVRRD